MPMHAKTKIRLGAIEQAYRALDALPEHRPEELTKAQAIQKLIVPIRATQSKGYSLAAIGQVLSECGIPITTGALRAYLSEATAPGSGRKRSKAKPIVRAAKETPQAAAQSSQKTAPAQPTAAGTKPRTAGAPANVDLDWEPEAPRERSSPSVAAVPRDGFYIRPDTKDL
jgi:hypothetical protein